MAQPATGIAVSYFSRYTDPGIDAYEQQYRERTLKNLKKKAQAFGLELIPISTPNECVSEKFIKLTLF
ncbi:hypothetical protein [uncultured Nostoc sp.]|uniref:hypothetical protein n=1 Tax=uncultured Nostoc sp. TaxID=340711 RepID=UPI0035CC2FAB